MRKLREAKKAEKAALLEEKEREDELFERDREDELFGDLEEIDQERVSLQTSSRNNIMRNTVSYKKTNKTNENFDNPFDQNSSISEENFHEENMEEFDDISTPKANVQFHTSKITPQRTIPSAIKRTLVTPEAGLEIIKEAEDNS